MTYYIGIDIAKYFHVASCIDDFGVVHFSSFKFDNSLQGFNSLLVKFNSLEDPSLIIGFESTAHYHENLFYFLSQTHHFQCELLNPISTSRFRRLNVRNVKNDNIDALSIAQFLAFNHSSHSSTFQLNDLQFLCVERFSLKQLHAKLYTQLTSLLDRLFPECKAFFKNNLKSIAAHNLLKNFASAKQIKEVRIDKLTRIISSNSKRYNRARIETLHSLAKESVGFHSDSLASRVKRIIYQIELLDSQIDEIEATILQSMEVLDSPILAIPGMGYIQAATILSAIQNINRFDTPCKVLAFAGLDPIVRQSGQFTARSTRMSKRGNALLRYALIWASLNCVKNSITMKAYYDKKRSEGKSHYNALGHCAKKLVNYIFFILHHPDKKFILN